MARPTIPRGIRPGPSIADADQPEIEDVFIHGVRRSPPARVETEFSNFDALNIGPTLSGAHATGRTFWLTTAL